MFRFAAHPQSTTPRLRQIGLVALACSVLIVSGCGGGTRKKEYMPERIVSFGDENSAMTKYESTTLDVNGTALKTINGLVYTVNNVPAVITAYCGPDLSTTTLCTSNVFNMPDVAGYTPTTPTTSLGAGYVLDDVNEPNIVTFIQTGAGTVGGAATPQMKRTVEAGYSCASNSIWTQVIAHSFGKGYKRACPLEGNGNAETYAVYGAKVAGLTAQVTAASQQGELRDGTLVTIMAGQNDILELYNVVKADSTKKDDAIVDLKARAQAMASTIVGIINTGANVVLALTPDLGQSPLGVTSGDAAMLTRLTEAFNNALYLRTWPGGGGNLALVNTLQTIYGLVGVVHGVALCDPAKTMRPDGTLVSAVSQGADGLSPLKYCTNSTSNFVTNGSLSTYMWADDTHFSTLGHVQIGNAGRSRAANLY